VEIFNNIIIKILTVVISISFLIYFIQLFDGLHKIKEFIRIKLGGKKSVSVDELIEADRINKMNAEIEGIKTEKKTNYTEKPF
jgi:hypothetical protein